MDLCVGLDVIIAGTMDAMAGITDAAADVDVVITTDTGAGIPSAKASARDTGMDTMMHCGTAAAVAVTMMEAVADAAVTVMAAVADAVTAAISPYALMPLPA